MVGGLAGDLGGRHRRRSKSEAMPTCPICGTEIEEGAGFCPECWRRLTGQQAARGKSKKKLVAIIVPCAIAIIVAIVLTRHFLPLPSGHVAELESVGISAYDFARELFDPELTSLQREDLWKNYEGKQVEWTNELEYVSTKQERLVAYFVNPVNWARTEVAAVFDESQRSNLLALNAGDLVVYSGTLASFGANEIELTNCTFLSLPVEPLWWNDDIETHYKRIVIGDQAVFLGPSTYGAATRITQYPPPRIAAISRESGDLLWEHENAGCVLMGIDSRHVYTSSLARLVLMSEPDYHWYWYACNMTALDGVSGQIDWSSYFYDDVDCLSESGCLPDARSLSDMVNCCIVQGSVKEGIASEGGPDLTFLIDKPPLSELAYQYQGVVYRSTCAVYGGVGTGCGALQATNQETGDILWMLTFQERGMIDFSIVDGILYVSTDKGVGAFEV
jgi:predicted nucleic acid-binding Zn ribbon protein